MIEQLIAQGRPLRLRTFNPILETFASRGETKAFLDTLTLMREKLQIIPRWISGFGVEVNLLM
jgi:hypothetical protein